MPTSPFYRRKEIIGGFAVDTWQRKIFAEFSATLTSKARLFPCVFGVSGFDRDQLRYAFLDEITATALADPLRDFARQARGFGAYTSLVVFSRPSSPRSLDKYHHAFWTVLKALAEIDEAPWPEAIPKDVDDPSWEFCFDEQPMFVVCNTPAHVARQSRRASAMMMTFQPRWVFDGILGTQELATRAVASVRDRLESYDFVAPAKTLGLYGDPENREALQYFLSDDASQFACPFTKLRS